VQLRGTVKVDRFLLTTAQALEYWTLTRVIVFDGGTGYIVDVSAFSFQRGRDICSVVNDHRSGHSRPVFRTQRGTLVSFGLVVFLELGQELLMRNKGQVEYVFVFPFAQISDLDDKAIADHLRRAFEERFV